MTWICCYDIEDDKLRQKLARLLEKAGWERLQKSIFATAMPVKEFNRFYKKIKDRFEAMLKAGDKVYIWNIGQAQFENVLTMGMPYDAKWIQGGYAVMYCGDEILLK